MLKLFSFLAIFAALALSSCKTMRLGDVLPETNGTPVGNVVLGKQNEDFFLVPDPRTLNDPNGPQAQVVVVKPPKEHPVKEAAHVATTPLRVAERTVSTVFRAVIGLASKLFDWGHHDPTTAPRPAPAYVSTPAPASPPSRRRSESFANDPRWSPNPYARDRGLGSAPPLETQPDQDRY